LELYFQWFHIAWAHFQIPWANIILKNLK